MAHSGGDHGIKAWQPFLLALEVSRNFIHEPDTKFVVNPVNVAIGS
jgi:hypothetical protein